MSQQSSSLLHQYSFDDQSAIVPLLRQYLPGISSLTEEDSQKLWGMWVICLEGGMEDILISVAAQVILKNRNVSIDEIATDLSIILQSELIKVDFLIFWRIYLRILQHVIWSFRQQAREALRNIPNPNSSSVQENLLTKERQIVTFLLFHATNCQDSACKRVIVSFIHQLFLENIPMIHKLHRTGYPLELIPWILEYAPSTHVLLDGIHPEIANLSQFDPFKLYLAATLALKYPLPKTLELCNLIVEKCQIFGQVDAIIAAQCLDIAILVLKAFPSLMSLVAPLMVTWQSQFGSDPEFVAATFRAAKAISSVNDAVRNPIYRKVLNLF